MVADATIQRQRQHFAEEDNILQDEAQRQLMAGGSGQRAQGLEVFDGSTDAKHFGKLVSAGLGHGSPGLLEARDGGVVEGRGDHQQHGQQCGIMGRFGDADPAHDNERAAFGSRAF